MAGLLIAGALVVTARWLPLPSLLSTPTPSGTEPSRPTEVSRASATSGERFSELPARAPLGPPRGALFAAPPPPPKPVAATPAEPAKPTPPPMPYRVAGSVAHDGVTKVVLARGDRVLTVEEGDKLDGGYRVEKIRSDEVTLVYEPLGMSERLAVAAAAAGTAPPSAPASAGGSLKPAQLRWVGPGQVKAGSIFTVAIRLTSSEPLRASPLELQYDAQLLEAVAVRPGKFFGGDASFSYRINPAGSIVVAASAPGASASDDELVVVSFKPIRPATAAEVRIGALQLQRPAGAPLAAEPLAPFRTAITP